MKFPVKFLTFLLLLAFSRPLTAQPANADMVVAADGSGDFTTLQAAINAVPSNSDRATLIFIKRGLYNTEKLIIPADKKNVTFIGESREETIISYHIYDCGTAKCPSADAAKWTGDNIRTSATLTIMGNGFRAENLTIQNTAGPVGQAQAITVQADKVVFVNCDLKGYQDTMYLWSSGKRSYFENCLVVGRTDYIYGGGIAFFNRCEIRSWGGGWITAPSTPHSQPYGFVFYDCDITYASGSPRAGDDEVKFRFGRPWNDYPKVAWLYCEITGMLNPQGWGDTWNMSYAATSTALHLYEYANTGPGADMSGRASWAGLRALTDEEALNYTVQKVMAGSDGWDPSADAPLVKQYVWTGSGITASWLEAANWNPEGVPASGESATVRGNFTVQAEGSFPADLSLQDMASLEISGTAAATYLSARKCSFLAPAEATLSGKVAIKDTLFFDISGTLTLNAVLSGIHPIIKQGGGRLILSSDNQGYSGDTHIQSGILEASSAGALGKGPVQVASGAALVINNNGAFHPQAKLTVVTGSLLELSANLTTSQFSVDSEMLPPGEYNATTHPGLIWGPGKVIVGRPESFTFNGGVWDNPSNFTPSLLPQAGETVICEKEMETTSTVFPAHVILRNGGGIRLRGNHQMTGTLHMEEGTIIKYNTGGTGMGLNAPISVEGNVTLIMESDNAAGSTMTLSGPVSGNSTITALNNGKNNKPNTGKLLLTGNNSGFSGSWDVSKLGTRYPGNDSYVTLIEGSGEHSFGKGTIKAAYKNKVIFNHLNCVSEKLDLSLAQEAKAVLGSDLHVDSYILNGNSIPAGSYSASTHPAFYEGTGTLVVGGSPHPPLKLPAFPGAEGHGKYVTGGRGGKVIYVTNLNDDNNPGSLRYALNQSGPRIILFKISGTIQLKSTLKITKGDVTIAGQTAPGDGITLRDYPVSVDADNVIIRFLRFRMGDAAQQEGDALGGREIDRVIIDHCSMSWSTDECVSFYQNENFTLQWCLISESLRNSVHNKGAHGYGGIWGGRKASFHHNLLAHHDSRNPRLGEMNGSPFALTDLVDLRNNVIYNWQGNSCYGAEGMNVNIVNCYYKPGPATGSSKRERIISIDKETETGFPTTGIWGKFFIDGNVLSASQRATNDNWTYGVYNQFNSSYGVVSAADKEAMRNTTPHNIGEITTHTAEKAYDRVLEFSGACLVRDTVDKRIIRDVSTGTATFMTGGNGSVNGIIDTQDHVGGWPLLNSLPAPADSDNDGMPDDWEDLHGLEKNSPDDAQLTTVDGMYPNIEVYINSLVAEITGNQLKDGTTTAVRSTIRESSDPLRMVVEPSSSMLRIHHSCAVGRIAIYTVTGTLLKSEECDNPIASVPIQEFKPGIYLVRLRDENQEFHSGKFIIH